ncbi:MAG: helix-turn-helix domain-containing protein [Tepidisphaeraceae bacterium]
MATAIKHPGVRTTKPSRNPKKAGQSEVRALRKRYGLSQELLSQLLDVSLRTASGVESGTVAPSRVRRNLSQVSRLGEALGEAMDFDHIGQWLSEPNEMLGGLKPVEAIERGRIDLVWQVVEGLRSGSPL